MKSSLLIATIFGLATQVANGISICPTYTIEAAPDCAAVQCLAQPTVTYTTKTSTTVTRALPCVTYTIGPVPITAVKRADSDAAICSPVWTTTTRPCCPIITTSKTTLVTSTATYTTYKPCPTKTFPPVTLTTIVLPTITAKPTTVSTTTKKPITCHCPGPVTVYDDATAAVAPDIVCLQYCPLETI